MTDKPLRLLLVEDKKHDYILSKRTLEKSHLACEIIWVQRGEDALNLLHVETFDVITLDFQLPDMNGLEVIDGIVARQIVVPVIFVTGSGNEQVAVEAMKRGAQDYMVKDPAGLYLELLPTAIEKAYRQWQDRRTSQLAEKMEKELALEHERMRILSEFIMSASHEFRTPLAVMKTSLYLLGRSTDADKRQQFTERIESQISNVARLVDDLVTMARLDGTDHFVMQPVQLHQVFSELETSLQAAIAEQGHSLILKLDNTLPEIPGDEVELFHAFQKLLDNAIRYTPTGGTITLSTYYDNQYVYVEIQDTGIGMRQEVIDHAFERFYRADEAHSTPGFGLGLSIARAIVEKHGGQITIASVVGQGSTFTVTLPL